MRTWILISVWMLSSTVVWADEPAAEKSRDYERWFVVNMMGQRAGWAVERTTHRDDTIVTESKANLTFARSGAGMTISMASVFEETIDGRPLRVTTTQGMGAMGETKTVMTFEGDVGHLTTTMMGAEQKQDLHVGSDWLTPAAMNRFVVEQRAAGEQEIAFRTIMPELGPQPIGLLLLHQGKAPIEVFGRTVPAAKYRMTVSTMPDLPVEYFVDAEMHLLRSLSMFGGMAIEFFAADEQLAKLPLDKAPEIMLTNEVIVEPSIEKPRQLEKAVYVLRLAEGKLPKLPDAAGPARMSSQSVRMLDERTAEVRVAVNGGFKGPAEDPKWKPPVVTHSTMVDGKDEAVVALTEKVTAKVKGGPGQRAEAMRQFVHAFIDEKNLGVGFASASEVARTATGDCSEHAVLLAAMLRADGIPSRTASGLIYVRREADQPGVMGYHMWTQAWLNGRWVDLDAVLDREDAVRRDAHHGRDLGHGGRDVCERHGEHRAFDRAIVD